ncbi:MAG: hypothetical protein A3F14_06425 [Gammaproteobacteria bacterium RIFCSPHIGHO2_12_FULL_43_28]|nr:MAG: hypothetical protein A3F14_06425 [Gammaproteobacteria bacterium RIFCSPHIGHO2_12_FULL_43_28]
MIDNIKNTPIETTVDAAVLAREVGADMLVRLDWMTIRPKKIVLLESVSTGTVDAIKARYTEAEVLQDLPSENQSVDLIFANLILPFTADVPALLAHWRRLLRPGGLVLASAFGPDTLKECAAFRRAEVVDMHNLGDGLLAAGLTDPVLDVDYYTMSYGCRNQLINEGVANQLLQDNNKLADIIDELPKSCGRYTLTVELVFAHAFAPDQMANLAGTSEGEFRVSVSTLRNQLNNNK